VSLDEINIPLMLFSILIGAGVAYILIQHCKNNPAIAFLLGLGLMFFEVSYIPENILFNPVYPLISIVSLCIGLGVIPDD